MKKFKDIVLKPGSYMLAARGEKAIGASISRLIRDQMAQCGFFCYDCLDSVPCDGDEKNPLSPIYILEKKIEDLEARLAALEP